MLDRGGEKEQREQSMTTEDLDGTIFVELATGERQYSDRECLEYEREYFPLHVFVNSCVESQTPILEDCVREAGAGDRSLEERESNGQLQTQRSAERDNQSATSIEHMNGKPHVAILAQYFSRGLRR